MFVNGYTHDWERNSSTLARVASIWVHCAQQARTCDELAACFPKASPEQAAVCEGAIGDRCIDDLLVQCVSSDSTPVSVIDCTAAGLICGAEPEYSRCAVAPCDPAVDQAHCQGDQLWECDSYASMWYITDCYFSGSDASEGMTCQSLDATRAECAGQEPCDWNTYVDHCEGTTTVMCSGDDQRVVRFDCRDLSQEQRCVDLGGFIPIIECGLGSECEYYDAEERCVDGVVRFCNAGQWKEFDCRAYGYSGCVNEIWDGLPAAYCVQ